MSNGTRSSDTGSSDTRSSDTRSSDTRSSDTRRGGTFVLLLDLLVPRPLSQVGQDLGQLGDHDVVSGESGLSLETERET